jgi:hypothetical protein
MRTKEKIMVKVVINDTKGIFQGTGTGLEIQSTFLDSVNLFNRKYSSDVELIVNSVTSSFQDSGTTYILGGRGENCLSLPSMTSANIGYTARIIVTGALQATAIAEAVGDSDRFLLAIGATDASGTAAKITTATNNLNFLTGCADADECAVVYVEYIDENKAVVLGASLT